MRAIRQTSGRAENEVVKGALNKNTVEDVLQKEDSRLEKIESRTDFLIEKSKKAKNIAKPSIKSSESVAGASPNHSVKINTVSYIDFVMLKGIKKEILRYIEQNIFFEEDEALSFIDTEEVLKNINTTANIIRDTIYRLKKDGWFEIRSQHYSRRIVKINLNNFRQTKH